MIKKYNDVISSVAFIMFSLVIFIYSFNIKKLTMTKIGADAAPKIVAILIFICGGVLLVSSLYKLKDQPKSSMDFSKYKNPIIILGMFLIYLLIMNSIGFLISTTIFLYLSFTLFTTNNLKKQIIHIVLSILITISVYLLFSNLLNLFLPKGILG